MAEKTTVVKSADQTLPRCPYPMWLKGERIAYLNAQVAMLDAGFARIEPIPSGIAIPVRSPSIGYDEG